ncbi:hypothetical protein AMK22_35555, partial [Streptomyces sp. CB01580]
MSRGPPHPRSPGGGTTAVPARNTVRVGAGHRVRATVEVREAVDAALLLAEMAVPHPARPTWPAALYLSQAQVPYGRMLSLDERLEGAAGRPV